MESRNFPTNGFGNGGSCLVPQLTPMNPERDDFRMITWEDTPENRLQKPRITLPKTNIAPENRPFQKEIQGG